MFVSGGIFFKGKKQAFFFPKHFDLFFSFFLNIIPKAEAINIIFLSGKR